MKSEAEIQDLLDFLNAESATPQFNEIARQILNARIIQLEWILE